MSDKTTYYQKIKKAYQIKQKNIMRILKTEQEIKQEISLENYLKKTKI